MSNRATLDQARIAKQEAVAVLVETWTAINQAQAARDQAWGALFKAGAALDALLAEAT